MPVNYRTVHTAAWVPRDTDSSHRLRYRALPFPEEWREAILALCNAGRGPEAEPWRTVPTRRLEQVLQAYAPDVLVMPRPFHERAEGAPARWLYALEDSPDPLPGPVLTALVDRWLGELRPEPEYREMLRDVRTELRAHPPTWEPVTRELLPQKTSPGGTAAAEAYQYTLSTDWLARRILALGPYPYEGGRLEFRAMPRGPRDKGAELVSQPLPYEPEPGKGQWWFSVVLNITLQTVPFDPLPRFHLHWSIRRWATRTAQTTGRLWIPGGSNTTVLLRPAVPVLPGVPLSERFAVAHLARVYDRERATFADGWAYGGPARLLEGLAISEPFPDPDLLLTDPEGWLTRDARAAIVYRNGMGRHEVKTGLMPHQCSQLTEWAAAALPEGLRVARPLNLTALAGPKPLNAPPASVRKTGKEAEEARRCDERRAAVAYAVAALGEPAESERPVLEARLLWQSADLREAALTALAVRLGLKGDGGSFSETEYEAAAPGNAVVHEWRAPELIVRVRCLRPVIRTDERNGISLTADLDLSDGGRHSRDAVDQAIRARRQQTAEWLAADRTSETVGLALVEIPRPEDFARDRDPKFALRLGCAKAGFVSQFIATPQKVKGYNSVTNMPHRALMAWDDGLRQLGARVNPEHGLTEGVPAGMRWAAVWMVRKNRSSKTRWPAYIPVGVLVTPDAAGSGLAKVQGWDQKADDGAGAWVPYPTMLITLTRDAEISPGVPQQRAEGDANTAKKVSWRANREEQRREAEAWMQKIRASLRREPTVLLADAANARSHWTWMQDRLTEPDRIRDGDAPARPLHPDLRLLRVRTGSGRETPQWWGVNPGNGPNGIAAHLWVPEGSPSGRIFYSTTPKPVQFQSSAVQADKLAPRPLTQGKRKGEATIDIGVPGWMPALVELAILGCQPEDGDDPEALALAAHLLRQPPDYPQALAHPLPLHLAGLGQEYVLPTKAEADSLREEAETAPDPLDGGRDGAADPDPALQAAAGLEDEPEMEEAGQLALFDS
ncbi:pPIWI_RE module domain-containing protein [Kitasatospora sp. NPDC058032]|uniref:pPIWI_RE module domain-containing protein n=1 Tax=Kitasatospora sp. NPDC058032 TaxID=3346307 RepID=UPI0036D8568E